MRDITFVGQMVISGNSTAVLCYQELLAVTFFTMHYCKIRLVLGSHMFYHAPLQDKVGSQTVD